jgi:colanic acid biosynthesis glycosyl transferase WcaI
MRVVVFDYSGHPAQVQLSRQLARQGNDVLHLHCPDYESGKGDLSADSPVPGEAGSLEIDTVSCGASFARYSVGRRVQQEVHVGRAAASPILAFQPDVALLSNIPLLGHAVLAEQLRRAQLPTVFWQQDVYSRAIGDAAKRRLGVVGPVVADVADRVERRVARLSREVVAISADYLPTLQRWGIDLNQVSVLPNWGPITEVRPRPKDNAWARAHGVADRPAAFYTGTLGLKHDPSILWDMAQELARSLPSARLVVVSQGQGRQWLEGKLQDEPLEQLVLLDYQPYEELPNVLGAADVVVAQLEPEAGVFSVPSKVLSYLCAGRPVLGVMPEENQAAQMISQASAGWVVQAGDRSRATETLLAALRQPEEARARGGRARAFAEQAFSLDKIGAEFEQVLRRAADPVARPPRPRQARTRGSVSG